MRIMDGDTWRDATDEEIEMFGHKVPKCKIDRAEREEKPQDKYDKQLDEILEGYRSARNDEEKETWLLTLGESDLQVLENFIKRYLELQQWIKDVKPLLAKG